MARNKINKIEFQIGSEPRIWHGYRFYREGEIFSPRGRKLVPYLDKNGMPTITVCIDGKKTKVSASRIMFELFAEEGQFEPDENGRLSWDRVVRAKDGNALNLAIDNLFIEKRVMRSRLKLEQETREQIRVEYGGSPRRQNQHDRERGISQQELAEKYDCSISTIRKILKEGQKACEKD